MTTVYVFGAGASCAEGAPSIANFMGKAFQHLQNDKSIEMERTWKFLQDYFDKDPRNYEQAIESYPQIDEIVTLVDYAINNNLSVSSTHSSQKFHEIRRGLINLISKTITDSIRDKGYHKKFVTELKRKKGAINVISLNYDTLLDDAIVGSYAKGDLSKVNYAFDSDLDGRFNLLKLHGSLNWALCPFCQNIRVLNQPVAHCLYSEIKEPCQVCNSFYAEPVMITPTLLKSYNIQRLNNVWLAASVALSQAKRIVFVGYSLAPADYPIIDLIKRAVSQKNILEEVVIVGIPDDMDSLRKRYSKIFGDRVEIAADDKGFFGQTHWDTPIPKH